MDSLCDVAIIGGGPAGSTAATFLARHGHRVLLFEKEKTPRFRIGESLLPCSMDPFERLGLVAQLEAKFLPKYGAEITTACGTNSTRVLFKNGFRAQHDHAYQVTRSEFDPLLLDHAQANGAVVQRGSTVEGLEFRPEEVVLSVRTGEGVQSIRARYLLDCSGRGSVVGNFFKLRKSYENLKKFSVFAHFEDVARAEGVEGTFIRLIRGQDRWFWMIPLTKTKMSIGLVMDLVAFKALKQTPEIALDAALREQPQIWSRMGRARRITEVHSASDYSYRNTSLAGDRWLLAGDAAGFIDPIFSTGVFLGIRSGEEAAEALHQALQNPAARARKFAQYERSVNRVMNLYLRFVNHWYKPQFAEVITHPVARLQLSGAVNAVLAGNLSRSFSLWWRMEIFYLVVFLQRFLPLCPRVSLDPRDCPPMPPLPILPSKSLLPTVRVATGD